MTVIFSQEAEADLEATADYLTETSPVQAKVFLENLALACLEIGQNPRAYQRLDRHPHLEYRRRIYRSYLIIYRLEDDVAHIIHIVHGARDLDPFLNPDD